MTRFTGSKWSTDACSLCGEQHSSYSGKLDAKDDEYVICGTMQKKIRVHAGHNVESWVEDAPVEENSHDR